MAKQTAEQAAARGFKYACVGTASSPSAGDGTWCGRPYRTRERADAHARQHGHLMLPIDAWLRYQDEDQESELPELTMDETARALDRLHWATLDIGPGELRLVLH